MAYQLHLPILRQCAAVFFVIALSCIAQFAVAQKLTLLPDSAVAFDPANKIVGAKIGRVGSQKFALKKSDLLALAADEAAKRVNTDGVQTNANVDSPIISINPNKRVVRSNLTDQLGITNGQLIVKLNVASVGQVSAAEQLAADYGLNVVEHLSLTASVVLAAPSFEHLAEALPQLQQDARVVQVELDAVFSVIRLY